MSNTESTKGGPEGTDPQASPAGAPTPDSAVNADSAPGPTPESGQAPSGSDLPPSAAPGGSDFQTASLSAGSDVQPSSAPDDPNLPLAAPAASDLPPTSEAAQPAAPASAYGDPSGAAPQAAQAGAPTDDQTRLIHAGSPTGAPHMASPNAAPGSGWQHSGPPVPSMYQAPGATVAPAKRGRGKIVAGAIALALIAGGAGGVAGWFFSDGGGDTTVVESVSMDAGDGMTYTEIVNKVEDSVVTVVTDSAEGSGVVYSEDGYIITNNHVVEDAQSIEVRFSDGTTAQATVVATDSTQDIAVIQVSGVDNLTPIEFADSDAVQVGDAAVAIGSPLGLEGTVTTGIVSALDRSMTISSEDSQNYGQSSGQTLTGLIQTDAAINSGNSGGALVNGNGELIGINTAIATTDSGSIGLGFAIPSNTVKDTVEQLIENGSVEQGYLGVSVADTDGNGAMILSVESGSPAEEAGLEEGDVITAVDGTEVTSASEVVSAVQSSAAGSEITITYTRDDQEQTTTATLGSS